MILYFSSYSLWNLQKVLSDVIQNMASPNFYETSKKSLRIVKLSLGSNPEVKSTFKQTIIFAYMKIEDGISGDFS